MSDQTDVDKRMKQLTEEHKETQAQAEEIDKTMNRLESIANEVQDSEITVSTSVSRQETPTLTLVYENNTTQATPDNIVSWGHQNSLLLISNVTDPNGNDVATFQAVEHSQLDLYHVE